MQDNENATAAETTDEVPSAADDDNSTNSSSKSDSAEEDDAETVKTSDKAKNSESTEVGRIMRPVRQTLKSSTRGCLSADSQARHRRKQLWRLHGICQHVDAQR